MVHRPADSLQPGEISIQPDREWKLRHRNPKKLCVKGVRSLLINPLAISLTNSRGGQSLATQPIEVTQARISAILGLQTVSCQMRFRKRPVKN